MTDLATKSDLKLLRDNPEEVCKLLNKAFATQEAETMLAAMFQALTAQNVSAIARKSGLRRDKLYGSLGGEVDPGFSRVIKLLSALEVRLYARPRKSRVEVDHPPLGRPIKNPSPVRPPRRRKIKQLDDKG
jgi:probable addiction module antidote protein